MRLTQKSHPKQLIQYHQTLNEIFNILTLYLPIDMFQRSMFIMHFESAAKIGATNPAPGGPSKGDFNSDPENWFQLTRQDGSKFALISAYQFEPPLFYPQTNFDLTLVKQQFDAYFANQEKARFTLARIHQDKLNNELSSSPNEYNININKPKPVREISSANLFPEINYGDFKIAPHIPNIGKASL